MVYNDIQRFVLAWDMYQSLKNSTDNQVNYPPSLSPGILGCS